MPSMKCFHSAFRVLLIVALMLNCIMAAQAATHHELSLAMSSAHGTPCHDDGMAGHEHHSAHKAACCTGGACFCSCAAPSLFSTLNLFTAPLPAIPGNII